MANVNYAELTLAANTVGLLKAKTDLAAVTTAGAKTEAGIKKSMKGVENAMKPTEQAAARAAAGMKDLRMSLDPLYASSKKFEAVQKQVAAAVKKGATTQAEANRIMALAEDRYLGMGGAAEVAATRMGGGAGGLAYQSRMAAMQLSQVAQQTAATGNFIQALSIQLPDLALGFGALGIGIGVVAGALLPMAANFVTGGEGAMELSDALDNASSELAEYIDLMSQSDALGAERFERTRNQIEMTSQAYADLIAIAKIEAFNSIEDLNVSLVESTLNARWLKTEMSEVGRLLEINTTNASNITVWKENREQVRAFISELEALRDASSLDEQYAAALQLRDAFKQTVDVNGELTAEQLAFWKTLSQSIQKMEIMGAAIEAQASGMSKVEQAAAKAAQQYAKSRLESEKSAAAASELLSQLQQEAEVRSLTLRYGADSVQVANARLEAERRSFVTQVQARDISESLKQQLIGAWDAANGAASASAGLSGKLSQASAFAAQLVANLGQVPGAVAAIAGQVDSAINSLQTQNRSLTYQLEQGITASSAAIKAQRDEALKLAAENGATIDQLAAMGQSFDEQAAKAEQLATANNAMTKTLSDQAAAAAKAAAGASGVGKAAGGAGKAMKAAAKEAEKFANEIERLEFDADPLKKYNAELANLNTLLKGDGTTRLSDGAYAHAVAELNDEFANSDPMISKAGDAIADFVAGGMRDFGDLLGAFKNMLKEMIATAIANPIKLSLMGVGGSMAGTAAQAAGAAPGGAGLGNLLGIGGGAGGMFGSLLGAWGGGSGILGGASAALGAFTSGGIGGGLSAVGAMAGQATAGLAGLGTAIGAIALPVAAVAAVFSFFKKKTEILDSGLRIMAEGMDLTLQEFEKVKTSRFWGLSKKVGMEFKELDEATAGPLEKAIIGIQTSVLDAADALGFASSTFDDFSISIDAATKGLSDEEAQAKIAEVLGNFANNFANMIPGLDAFTTEGMNMHEVLLRIVNSLSTTNAAFDQLGFSLFEMSLDGAAAAEAFIGIFGSLDNMVAASSAYYQRFYTDAERVTDATDTMREALADLGLVMPATIEGFRALVEQAEAMGQTHRVGQLINLSGAFAGMIDGQNALQEKAAQDLQAAFAREMEATRAASQAAISGLQNSLTGARERLASSRAIANALESALKSRIFPSVEAERQAQDRAADYLRSLVGQAEINDLDALQAALQAVANPSADTYATLEDYRRDFDRTSGVIAELERTASTALTADEQMVSLLEQQISAAENSANRQIDLMQAQLDALLGIGEQMSLEDAIANFEAAQAAAAANPNTGDPIEQIYQDVLGRSADAAGLAFYRGLLNSGALTVSQIRADIAGSNEAITGNVPSFAGGGYTGNGARSGGLDGKGGFMAMLHPRETVTDHSQGGNGELVAELRRLRSEVAELKQINITTARHTGKSAALAQKRDDIGTLQTNDGDALLVKVVS